MKLRIKISIALLVILILLFSAACIYVVVKGKALLTEKLEDALKKEVNIGYLGLRIPLGLEIKDLKIGKLAEVDYVYVSPSLLGLLKGQIILNKVNILRPEINWEIKSSSDETAEDNLRDNSINISSEKALANTKEVLDSPRMGNKQPPPIIIKHLTAKQGIINFTDSTVSESGMQITLKEVSFDVDNLCLFPKSAITDFQLTAKIPWQEDLNEGTVYASGWINLYKKEMQARLELEGIDGVYLHPYYSNWVDLENARIEEARLNFFSDIQGQNNELVAKCRLELTDIKFRPRPADEPEHKAEKITTAVLGIFRALNQGGIILNFTIRTKMDKPEFNFSSINQAVDKTLTEALESDRIKIEDAILQPGKFIKGVTEETTEATKAIVNGVVSVGKGLLDALKTEEEPEEAEPEQEKLLEN